MTQPKLPIPNPEDWTDTGGAADILGKSRATVHEMASSGVITRHPCGISVRPMFWVPELKQVRAALDRVSPGAGVR